MKPEMKIFSALSRRLRTPEQVQEYIRSLSYNREEKGETIRSAIETYRLRRGHCLESALLTAGIMEQKGHTPLLLSLDSKDDLCHSVFAFKTKSGWGSIGKSRFIGLHGREPRFRSIRDLALSYFDPFVDKTGRLTGYTLVPLEESGTDWRFSPRNLWALQQFVVTYRHVKIKSSNQRFRKLHQRYLREGEIRSGKFWW